MKLRFSALILSFLFFVTLLSRSAIATTTENSTYYDWRWTHIGNFGAPYNHVFFSALFMGEQKYFVISKEAGSGTTYSFVYRFDSFGMLEDTKQSGFEPYANIISNDILINYPDEVLFPRSELYVGVNLDLIRFNITNYLAGNLGLSKVGTIASGGSYNQNLISISPRMTQGAYPSGIVTVGASTFAVINEDSIYWDFYDLPNHKWNTSHKQSFTWDSGLSDIQKNYVYPSEGNCFYYADCVFHVLFEGKSSQNGNRRGIYVRELRKGLFGWDTKDKGLIGFDSPTGFIFQTSGIDYWTTFNHYPFLVGKIYFRTIQSNDRIIAYDYFDVTDWSFIEEKLVNVIGTNSFMPDAKVLDDYEMVFNTTLNVANQSYVYFVYKYSYSNGIADTNITITNEDNVSTSWYERNVTTVSGSVKKLIRVDAPANSSTLNITVVFTNVTGTLSPNYVYADVFGDSSHPVIYRDDVMFTVTEDVQGGTEAYSLLSYIGFLFNGTNNLGIQTVDNPCSCTNWVTGSCYNSTHRARTRICSPSLCSFEIYYIYDVSCGMATTTTTTIPTPCTAGNKCYNSTHLCYQYSNCSWNLPSCSFCTYYCDPSHHQCYSSPSCPSCPTSEYEQEPYPDCTCSCPNFCALGYKNILINCACKDSTIDTSAWQDNPVLMFQDISSGLLALLGNLAIPLAIIFLAIGFAGVITLIMKRGIK